MTTTPAGDALATDEEIAGLRFAAETYGTADLVIRSSTLGRLLARLDAAEQREQKLQAILEMAADAILWIKVGIWRAHHQDGYEEGWREAAVGSPFDGSWNKLSPTYWMPLPAAPTGEAK